MSLILKLVRVGKIDMYRVAIAGEHGKMLLELGPFGGEDAVATWRSLSASSGLPLVIAGPDGELHQPYRQLGRLQLGMIHVRRHQLAVLSGRRPRFLTKRKAARLPQRPLVYREQELVPGVERA